MEHALATSRGMKLSGRCVHGGSLITMSLRESFSERSLSLSYSWVSFTIVWVAWRSMETLSWSANECAEYMLGGKAIPTAERVRHWNLRGAPSAS